MYKWDNADWKAYLEIARTCLSDSQFEKIKDSLEHLNELEFDPEYYLATVEDISYEKDVTFIIDLDNRAGIQDLYFFVNKYLSANYNSTIEEYLKEEKDLAVRSNGVFENCDNKLRKIGFQIGFIGIDEDAFAFVIHKIDDQSKIKTYVEQAGYEYTNVMESFHL